MGTMSRVMILVCAGAALALAGCMTAAGALAENPGRYHGKAVTVSGRVAVLHTIPFTRYSVYLLEAGPERVPVFSTRKREEGATVIVRAEVACGMGLMQQELAEKYRDKVSCFLLENGCADGEIAKYLSEKILRHLGRLSAEAEELYFLLEE